MDFVSYLAGKKIDAVGFRAAEPEMYREWELEFSQMHPESFTARKKYFLNPIRRKYLLKS